MPWHRHNRTTYFGRAYVGPVREYIQHDIPHAAAGEVFNLGNSNKFHHIGALTQRGLQQRGECDCVCVRVCACGGMRQYVFVPRYKTKHSATIKESYASIIGRWLMTNCSLRAEAVA